MAHTHAHTIGGISMFQYSRTSHRVPWRCFPTDTGVMRAPSLFFLLIKAIHYYEENRVYLPAKQLYHLIKLTCIIFHYEHFNLITHYSSIDIKRSCTIAARVRASTDSQSHSAFTVRLYMLLETAQA